MKTDVRDMTPAQCRELLQKLTDRQREVLALVADGLPNKAIAWKLDMSERTVNAHRRDIYTRLEVNCTAHAVVLAVRGGV